MAKYLSKMGHRKPYYLTYVAKCDNIYLISQGGVVKKSLTSHQIFPAYGRGVSIVRKQDYGKHQGHVDFYYGDYS